MLIDFQDLRDNAFVYLVIALVEGGLGLALVLIVLYVPCGRSRKK
jgi:hypothetical protein